MTNTYFSLAILSTAFLSTQLGTHAVASASCPIAKSLYRDGDGQGFQLVFSPPPTGTPFHATAAIKDREQRTLYQFKVSQSSGYGSIWLENQDAKPPQRDRGLWMTFFDQNLKSATPRFLGEESKAPKYAVIAELGSYDYYNRKNSGAARNSPSLSDAIWIFDRCQ